MKLTDLGDDVREKSPAFRLKDLFPKVVETEPEPDAVKPKKDDLFAQFDKLFQGVPAKLMVGQLPYPPLLGRWLGSDVDYVQVAKFINLHTMDAQFAWEIWRGALSRSSGAPRMKYVANKKPEQDAAVERIIAVEHCKRDEAEFLVALVGEHGQAGDPSQWIALCAHYGVDDGRKRKPDGTAAGGGLSLPPG